MRQIKTWLIILALAVWGNAFAQEIDFLDKTDSLQLKKEDKTFVVKFQVSSIQIAEACGIIISGKDCDSCCKAGIDYTFLQKGDDNMLRYVDNLFFMPNSKSVGEFIVYAKHQKETNFAKKALLTFIVKRTDKKDTTIEKTILFTNVTNKQTKKQKGKEPINEEDDTADTLSHFTFLNAYNFDFGNTVVNSKYVGQVGFFKRDAFTAFGKNIGVIAGVMKINYGVPNGFGGDSTLISNTVIQKFKINPFDGLDATSIGKPYLNQYNKYITAYKTNSAWSFYVQPTIELTNNSHSHIYAHMHAELLVNNYSSQTIKKTIRQDTAIFKNEDIGKPMPYSLTDTTTYISNSVGGYFGIGLTFDIALWKNGRFFFQPTIGRSTIGDPLIGYAPQAGGSWKGFYLIRSNFNQSISQNSMLILGIDIRGMLPKYAPRYAAYIGLSLGLDNLLNLINGK